MNLSVWKVWRAALRAGALLTFLVCAGSVTAQQKSAARPNIVIFLTDDQSQLDASPYGSTLRTPNMQRLADNGLTFTRAFVASPSCAPSRAALLTSLMPARNGAEPNQVKPRADVKKWPAYFQELGYEVVAFGKVSHYKHTADYGFDHFEHDTFHDPEGIPAAVNFLKKQGATDKPLCIFVGSNWPHVPWPENTKGIDPVALLLPASSIDTPATREWRARYAAAVTKADDELGLVYDAARATLGENILFLFSADHGAQWPFAKWNLYDAGIRVPLIMSWAGVVKANQRTDAMVSWVDFLPTLLEAAGGKTPADIDGRSFLPVLRGDKSTHRDHIFATHSGDGNWNIYPARTIRNDRWKYILNLHPEFAFTTHIDLPGNLGQRAYFASWEAATKTNAQAAEIVRRYHERPAEELYDLEADPNEQHNVSAEPAQRTRLKEMRAELEAWMREQGDKRTVFNEPRLLSDATSYGPKAVGGDAPRQPKANANPVAITADKSVKPNIVLILTDDMGYGDVGCYGGKFAPTPNIDKMAKEGIRFTQYYSASPICSPSRTGILTGMYPGRWRITSYLQTRKGNSDCGQADFLDPKAPSIARTLKSAGYATGHFGKWHMGGGRDVTNAPLFREYGFDENASTYESPEPHPDITATNWIWSEHDKVKRWDRTAFFVDKSLDFLKRHKDQPCYVNLWPDDVHTPWVPSGERLSEYPNGPEQERKFRAVLDEYDRQFGRFFAGLKEMGLEEKTLVIFTSDNGALPTFNGKRSAPLRGSKLSVYEGGIRMPFIVRWPGRVPAGKVDEESVLCAMDFFPSFCAVAGVPLPGGVKFDGQDRSAVMLGKPAVRQGPLFWEYGRNETAFAYPKAPDRSPNVAVRDGKWKLLINANGSGVELYDLNADISEHKNVAEKEGALVKRLSSAALEWRKSLP